MKKFFLVAFLTLTTICSQVTLAERDRRPTITVLYFDNNSTDRAFDPLRKGFADMLITDLSSLRSLRVVEREKLEYLLREIKLGQSGFIQKETAQKLGKGLAAQYVVAGSFVVEKTAIRVDAKIIRVETGEIVLARAFDGKRAGILDLEKQLVAFLSQGLASMLTESDRSILASTSEGARSFDAFEAYSRGIDELDAGKRQEAQRLFEQALQSDPAYRAAKNALDRAYAVADILDKRTGRELETLDDEAEWVQPGADKRAADLLSRLAQVDDPDPDTIKKVVRLLIVVVKNKMRPTDPSGTLLEMKMLPELLAYFCDDVFADETPTVIEYLYKKYSDRPETSGLKKELEKLRELLEMRKGVATHQTEIKEGRLFMPGAVSDGYCEWAMARKASYDYSGFAVFICQPNDYLNYVKLVRVREWDEGNGQYPWDVCHQSRNFPISEPLNKRYNGWGLPSIYRERIKVIDEWITKRKQLNPVRPELRKLAAAIRAASGKPPA